MTFEKALLEHKKQPIAEVLKIKRRKFQWHQIVLGIWKKVVCEKRGVTGSFYYGVALHLCVQSSLSSLFRFYWICFALTLTLLSHLQFVCQGLQEIVLLFSFLFLHAISSYCTCAEVQWVQFPALNHTALELLRYVTFLRPPNSLFFQKHTESFGLISFWPRKIKAMLKQQSRQGTYCVKIPLFYLNFHHYNCTQSVWAI